MHYGETAEQEAIRRSARAFAQKYLLPRYQTREREGRLERDMLRSMGELGFIGSIVPENLGGSGIDNLTMGIIVEEIAYGDHGVSYVPLLSTLAADIVMRFASEGVKNTWLPKLCSGEAIAAIALTEPAHGSDAAHIQLRATKKGESYLLQGEKTSISLAEQADVFITFARTEPQQQGAHGISAFLIPADSEGLRRTHFDDLGARCVGRGSLFFDNVAVSQEHLLDQPGRGFTQVMQGFDFSRALIGLQCIGTAQASVDETWPYVTERKAFGAPLVSFEGVSFPLAEAETQLEAARQLCYKTLWLRDAGRKHTAEAAMCKWWAPKLCYEVITNCLLLHGHAGYGSDYAHQQRLRDVLGLQIGDGTAQIMKLIIARERVGRVAIPY